MKYNFTTYRLNSGTGSAVRTVMSTQMIIVNHRSPKHTLDTYTFTYTQIACTHLRRSRKERKRKRGMDASREISGRRKRK